MDENPLSFLSEEAPDDAGALAPAAEQHSDEAPAADGPARGPDGKFIAAEPKPEPADPVASAAKAPPAAEPEPEPAPVVAATAPEPTPAPEAQQPQAQVPPGYVPVGVVQELRKEIQALKQPPAPAAPPPDPTEDLEAYEAYQEQRVASANIEWSYRVAVAQHGEETAKAAREWGAQRADHDPTFYQAVLRHDDPIGFVMGEYQRHQAMELFADPKAREAFAAFMASQGQAAAPPSPAAAQPPVVAASPDPPAPTPPRSLAAEPNAGGVKPGAEPLSERAAYDALFLKG